MAGATKVGPRARTQIKQIEAFEFKARQGWVPVSKLISDPAYQRPVDIDRVRAMAVNFNPDALGSIMVSHRTDGTYATLDGFHRASLMRLMGWEDQKMPATIYEGLSVQEEADLFRIVNQDRVKPRPLALFKARVTAGDRSAVDLANVLTTLGLSYDSYSGIKGGIRAIDTIQRVQDACGIASVRRALTVMIQAWGHDSESLNGEVFKGVALLLHYYGAKVDLNDFAGKLREHTPNSIRARSRQMKEIMPEWQGASCTAAVLVQIYNFRLRATSRLDTWEGQNFPRKALAHNKTGKNQHSKNTEAA